MKIGRIELGVGEPTKEDYRYVGKELCEALKGTGLVYILDHGLPQDLIDNALTASRDFFLLPKEEKAKFNKYLFKTEHGYTGPGRETFSDPSKFVS